MTYKVQIDDLVRDATPDEVAAIDAQRADLEAQAVATDQIAAARASARAKLAALGLTDAEVAALLGA
jgi:hypothetical protein